MLAMERNPIRDTEIKYILKQALTDKIDDREVYMKGIDYSYYYEGYTVYKAKELSIPGMRLENKGMNVIY